MRKIIIQIKKKDNDSYNNYNTPNPNCKWSLENVPMNPKVVPLGKSMSFPRYRYSPFCLKVVVL